ncbi:hypothetical protein VTO42DRAFT_8336 [Malbranchea cinnamomea]
MGAGMEFPTGTITNFHVIDDLTNLHCRLYCTKSLAPSVPGEPYGHPGNLESPVLTLRSFGWLVSAIPNAYGIWVFSEDQDFHALRSVCVPPDDPSRNVVHVDGFEFHNCIYGTTSVSDLAKRFMSDPNAGLLQTGIFQSRIPEEFAYSLPVQSMTTFAVLYRSFISAVAGLLILRATLRYGAIPLGKRTLFTATDPDGYERTPDYPFLGAVSFLSTLNIDISCRGKLLVSWRPVLQPGLERLSPNPPSSELRTLPQFGEDIWIAPTGTVCRFISTVGPQAPTNSQTRLWRRAVRSWLRKYGLDCDGIDSDIWVEIESVSPFNSHGSVESESRTSSPFSRTLWPAKYCFKRTRTEPFLAGTEFFVTEVNSPLLFAEKWMADSVSRKASADLGGQVPVKGKAEEPQPRASSPQAKAKNDLLETIESLARTIHFPDLTISSAVYPTPPGGTLPPSAGAVVASEGLDSIASVLSTSRDDQTPFPAEDITSTSLRRDSEPVLGDLGVPPSQLGVGSGMYDTGPDDLFGDMDGELASKEITEADFNFFDEPDFTGAEEDVSGMQQPAIEGVSAMTAEQERVQDAVNEKVTSTPNLLKAEESRGENPTPDPHIASGLGGQPELINDSVNSPPEHVQGTIQQAESQSTSPPLSPSRVRDILLVQGLTSSDHHESTDGPIWKKPGPEGRYNHVQFSPTVGSSDQKYEVAGRFWFSPSEQKPVRGIKHRNYPDTIPILGFPSKKVMLSQEKTDLTLLNSMNSVQLSPSSPSDDSSDDESQVSVMISEISSPSSGRDIEKGQPSSSADSESETPSSGSGSIPNQYTSFLGSLFSRSTDWSLAGYFSRRLSDIAPVLSQVEELTQVAQLVVDQITQSSFLHNIDVVDRFMDGESVYTQYPVVDTAELLDKSKALNLRSLLSVDDTPTPAGQRKDVPAQGRQTTTGGIYKLNPSHIRIHRGDKYLETLPPAVSFWETFGLEPLQGPKDVISYCIYPSTTQDYADAFLERLGSTYSGANLGLHSRPSTADGLIPWSLSSNEDRDYKSIMHSLQHTCENLGTDLSNLPRGDENIVVYILNPFPCGAALGDICSAFLRLFRKYVEDPFKKHPRQFNELVLQIVPLQFVAAIDSLVVPAQSDYMRLALEVYSRCAPKGRGSEWTGCAPPLVLVEMVPRAIPFKLTSDGVSPLEDGRCFHIAYSHSLDRRWITAAWTDNTGQYQMNMSYCLRERSSNLSRPIVEVLRDIWRATQEISGLSHRHWRVMIAKDEPLEREEIAAWTMFAQKQNQTKQAKVELTLLYVNTTPGLLLRVPPTQTQLNAFSHQITQPTQGSSTPVSTPKPGVPSPDPSSNASTPHPIASHHTPIDQQPPQQQQGTHLQPNFHQYQQHPQHPSPDSDPDPTLLVDKTDETWAITLSHRLNTSPSLSTYRPAQASGYLLRRRGISDTDGLASLAVNVIYTQARLPADVVLKDILRMYRDLATLSRTRGIAHAQGSCPLPWHIATAVKGQEALSYIL